MWHLELRGRLEGLAGSTWDAYRLFRPLLAVTDAVVAQALALDADALGANDRIHVATCRRYGFNTIVSADAEFDDIDDIDRIGPADVGAVARLLTHSGGAPDDDA